MVLDRMQHSDGIVDNSVDQFGNTLAVGDNRFSLSRRYVDVGDKLADDAQVEDLYRFRRLIRQARVTSERHGFIAHLAGKYPFFVPGLLIAACWAPAALLGFVERADHPSQRGAGATIATALAFGIALVGVSMMMLQWWSRRHVTTFLASRDTLVMRVGFRAQAHIPMLEISRTQAGHVMVHAGEAGRRPRRFLTIEYGDPAGERQWISYWSERNPQPVAYIRMLCPDLPRSGAGINRSPYLRHWTAGLAIIAFGVVTALAGALSVAALIERPFVLGDLIRALEA